MGQLFIAQGDSATKQRISGQGVQAFSELAGIVPAARVDDDNHTIITFPRKNGSSADIVKTKTKGWATFTGTLFYKRHSENVALGNWAQNLTDGRVLDSIQDCDGPAALAYIDSANTIHIITDHLGTQHLYYTNLDGCIVISTSALILAYMAKPSWNTLAVQQFLETGSVFGEDSLFQGINRFSAGTWSKILDGRIVSIKRHWSVAQFSYDSDGNSSGVLHLANALGEEHQRISDNYAQVQLDLTGGLDSRALLASWMERKLPFSTVVNGPVSHPDVITANRIADVFQLPHQHYLRAFTSPDELWDYARRALAFCDGEYDIFEYASILKNHTTLSEQFSISVNGSGGEVTKGYWWELVLPFYGGGVFREAKLVRRRIITDPWYKSALEPELDHDLQNHLTTIAEKLTADMINAPSTAKVDNLYLLMRMQCWQGRIASSTERIWPCVSPFMFKRPLAIALSTPVSVRAINRMSRNLIHYLNPELAALPLEQGYPASPLTFTTALLHSHRLVELFQRAYRKLAIRNESRHKNNQVLHSQHSWLEVADVRDLLQYSTMLTKHFYRKDPRTAVSTDSHLGRIITLEHLARTISS